MHIRASNPGRFTAPPKWGQIRPALSEESSRSNHQPPISSSAARRDRGCARYRRAVRAIVDVTVESIDADHSTVTISVDFVGHRIGRVLVPS